MSELSSTVEENVQDMGAAVAIIGMAGQFPGAPDVGSFWKNLVEGKDSITRFSAAESQTRNSMGAEEAKDFVAARGVLDDAAMFDADFFGINPREAERMDPQHRVFLEACSNALETAGYVAQEYPGEIGLFAGCAMNTYLLANLCGDRAFIDQFTANYQVGEYQILTGNDKDFLTTRVAYKLNLRGPVMTVQGACATSLVAICQAAQSLLNYQCEMALAGGVSITFPQLRGHVHQEGGLASSDGFCRPFDAKAAGTVFGHGAGVVLLKRYEDAVRDGDAIAAVIRGFAVNNDGAHKAGYMAPGVDGQARVIAAAQAMAGVSADSISYIEAHGTGTPMGDPIEIAALTKAFRESTGRKGFCAVGTAKGNVGHLDAAAGVTGVIKTVMSLQHRMIPGLAHFEKPNEELRLAETPFTLSGETKPWVADGPLRAGVSAFGVGGVNAHVILEEAPRVASGASTRAKQVLCLSAGSDQALNEAKTKLAAHLEADSDAVLVDVAYTLAAGRKAYQQRFAIAATDATNAVVALRAGAKRTEKIDSSARRVAFLFSGQGSQFVGMGKELYASNAVYQRSIDECCEIVQRVARLDLRGVMFAEESEAATLRLQETRHAQPALFATELALARLWQSWGIEAAASVGHSLGEFVAATLAGVFSIEDALRLVCLRGQLMQQMVPGAMISVPLGEEALAAFVSDEVCVAALNSPRASVLAGSLHAIAELEARFEREGVAARRLRTSHAFHSAMMEPMLAEFEAEVARCERKAPLRRFVSSVTGTWITDEQATSPQFWAEQCRKPVRFSDAVETLLADGVNVLLEVGPGEALTALASQQRVDERKFVAVASLPAPRAGAASRSIEDTVAGLWSAGVAVDWAKYFGGERRIRVALPTYPFERKLYWVEPPAKQPALNAPQERTVQETNNMQTPGSVVEASPVAGETASRTERLRAEAAAVFADLSGIEIRAEEMELSFLELGLDSLFLTQATLSLQKKFGVKVTFRQLMEQCSSIVSLADHLDALMPPDAPKVATPAVVAATSAPLVAANGTQQPLERLLADQLAALSEMFASQVATLRAAAGGATPAAAIAPFVAAPVAVPPSKTAAASADSGEVRFRPAQVKVSAELDAEQQRYIDELIAKYAAKTPGSKRMTQASRGRLADPRAVAGFRPQWKEMVYPLLTDRAQGSRIWDVDGNEYIDVVNGYGCIMFGHSPKFVVDAAHAQLDRGVAIGPQSVLAGEVAALICELTGNERVTFCNTGSEAVMAAIRVARTVTGRDKFVYFTGDYHGTFDEVLIRSTPRGSAPVAPGIPLANVTNVVVLDYGAQASLDYIREHGEEIAAVLIEPVQTRHPENKPFEFIRSIRTITEQTGSAMIIDEVVTGFRLAPGGVQEFLGVRADMCTYGKVIGGGHPIGVLSGKAQYLDALDGGAWQFGDDSAPEVGVTFFAGTFVRHPLAMAAARAVLTHLKNAGGELQRELNRKTAKIAESLDAFFQERGVPSRVHHFASWFYFTFPGEAKLASLFYYAMRAKGIHIQEGYPCFLTTAHTDADLEAVERAFRETIVEMQQNRAMPGGNETAVQPRLQEPALHALALRNTPERVAMTEPQREVFLAAALSDESNCAFNESLTVKLRGPVRIDDLRFALEAVISRHDALRSVVCEDGDCLCVDPVYSGSTEVIDLRGETAEKQQTILAERVAHEGKTPFDLQQGPLVRSACYVLSGEETVLVLTAHHIVLDGWSANQLLEEISVVYSKGAAALTTLAPLLPFSSYAVRENERQQSGDFANNEKYWVAKFEGRSPRLDLPTDRVRPTAKSYSGATLEGKLGKELYDGLKKLSAKNGCSLYVTLLSSFQLLMHRLTKQDEVVVGISTAGQALLDGASLVGHCVNFLPMLSELGAETTLPEHLRATRSSLLDAQDHQEFTYGSLVRKLPLEREAGRLPLIEVQFNLEKVGTNVRFDGLEAEIRTNAKQFVNTDLFLNVVESASGLDFACDYNTELFDAATLERWMRHWSQMLAGELADPVAKVKELPLLTAEDKRQVVEDWNQTTTDFGTFTALPSVVLEHAMNHPDRIAIECGGRQWTYAELAEYATMLARRLVHEGLQPGDLVGICIERSIEMAGSLLAVMMAGGAYVPLDPRHPRERLATIINDAGMTLLLTGRDPSVDTSARILNITGPQPQHKDMLPASIAADSLAYVIYTSGSTGVPKGVAIEHKALMNLLRSMQCEPGLGREDVLVAVTTLAFDIAALELFLPMLAGAKLVIATDEQVTNGGLLLRLIEESKATGLQATPGAWRILLDAGWTADHALKVLCGGEALPRDLADALLERSDDVWNVYGPTETTIWSSATRVTAGASAPRVGPPIANTQFYVLDERLQPMPVGVVGELCIGGDGLARGYWKRPELTAEKFVASTVGEGRIYRTGDLGRWHSDGTIELLGRVDFQVKIRGYRIELGEIEAALAAHEAVREAIVLDQKAGAQGSARLLAFVDAGGAAAEPQAELLIAELKDHLDRTLPAYMVPAVIVALKELPRLPNTKVDRKALLKLGSAQAGDAAVANRVYTPPVTPQEELLAGIWADVLQLENVSTSESIFELGADSLAIFRIAARAQREGLALKATQIFEHRTIAAICREITQKSSSASAGKSVARIRVAPRDKYRVAR
ncbi:MAG: amino acid adenylation domain-containing protein [Acidobacteriota bacterium]